MSPQGTSENIHLPIAFSAGDLRKPLVLVIFSHLRPHQGLRSTPSSSQVREEATPLDALPCHAAAFFFRQAGEVPMALTARSPDPSEAWCQDEGTQQASVHMAGCPSAQVPACTSSRLGHLTYRQLEFEQSVAG